MYGINYIYYYRGESMTPESIYFSLYLITVPDIESDQRAIHRIYFEDFEQCNHYAEILDQRYDPVVRKPNCFKVDNYIRDVRIPLRKPEFMK